MREDPLTISTKLPVSGLVLIAGPLPASGLCLDASGFHVALRERPSVHDSIVPYLNG